MSNKIRMGNQIKTLKSLRLMLISKGAPRMDSPYAVADAFLSMRGVSAGPTKKGRMIQAWQLAAGYIPPTPVATRPVVSPKSAVGPSKKSKEAFYRSWEWRTLRMEVLKTHGHRCQSCGATPANKTVSGAPVRLVVDHIKPLSKFWNLRLERSNLQVLCDECNMGKGAWDETDYRPAQTDVAVTWGDSWDEVDRQAAEAQRLN